MEKRKQLTFDIDTNVAKEMLHSHFEYDGTAGKFALHEKYIKEQKPHKSELLKNRLKAKREYIKQRDSLQNGTDIKMDKKISKDNPTR